jgi:hypothetical protein
MTRLLASLRIFIASLFLCVAVAPALALADPLPTVLSTDGPPGHVVVKVDAAVPVVANSATVPSTVTTTTTTTGAPAAVSAQPPLAFDPFWLAVVVLGCGLLTAVAHRLAASVAWMQRPIGALLSATVVSVATSIGAAVASMGLTRGLVLVALSAVSSAVGSYNPTKKPGDDSTLLSLPTSRAGCVLPWIVVASVLAMSAVGCTPAQSDAWRKIGTVDTVACAAKDVKGALSTTADALVADLEKQAAADPSAWSQDAWAATGKTLATTVGVDYALCLLAAAWARLGPVLFADLPATDPRIPITWLLSHTAAWAK